MAGNIFGKLTSDALGLSDIGKILDPKDFDKADVDDYIFHEDNEKIYFVIKSQSDEYCFTNLAILHLDGTSAISKRKILNRYDYSSHTIKNVKIETAGTIDLDCELKFSIAGNKGEIDFSIDINKKQEDQIKDIYKSLYRISLKQKESKLEKESRDLAIKTIENTLNRVTCENIAESFEKMTKFAENWYSTTEKIYHKKDYSDVYELYINN